MKLFCVLVCLFLPIWGQDIAFPTDDNDNEHGASGNFNKTITERTRHTTSTERQRRPTERPKPVRDPIRCPGNQLYYPGEPWFCDCGPSYVFYKPENECYLAYTQGPCAPRQHIIVKNRTVQCVRNPCPEGEVRYNGRCFKLESTDGPCEDIDGGKAVLKINPNTIAVECIRTAADPFTLFNFPERCPPGSKRDANNKCRENWNV